MKALLAIVTQTIRSSLRSRVFWVLGLLLFLAVVLLPLTVAGDGTAKGLVQISLTYSMGVVTALLSAATLWLACSLLPREIETYQIHLVMTKPTPPWLIWTGKWLGIFLIHASLFVASAVVIYGLVHWRLGRGGFPEEEMTSLRREVLVGRRISQPLVPDFGRLARMEYERRKSQLDPGHDVTVVMQELLRQVRAKTTEVPIGATRPWVFRNVATGAPDEPIYVRYRLYVGSTSKSGQRQTEGVWGILDPASGERQEFQMLYQRVVGGNFYELSFPPAFVSEEGQVVLSYTNYDPGEASVIFQTADGPVLLMPVSGFLSNYLRACLLVVLQLGFLSALGCAVGAAMSTPVAIFAGVSYLIVGMMIHGAVTAPMTGELGQVVYSGPGERVLHYIALATNQVVVSYEEFAATADLSRGRLIEMSRMARTLFSLVLLRGGALAALGMWVLTRRELGTVIRR